MLRKELRLRVLEVRVPRKIFGPNDEVTGRKKEFFMIFTAHETLFG
jgi:hypothetical protein